MAVLQLESVWAERTVSKIRKALDQLPTKLEDTYEETITRIKAQQGSDSDWGIRILQWLSCAKRPLRVEELCQALAVEWDGEGEPPRELDMDNILKADSLVDVCAGLVVIDSESGVIRLVHFTAEEYFRRHRDEVFPEAGREIVKTCVAFLSFDIANHRRWWSRIEAPGDDGSEYDGSDDDGSDDYGGGNDKTSIKLTSDTHSTLQTFFHSDVTNGKSLKSFGNQRIHRSVYTFCFYAKNYWLHHLHDVGLYGLELLVLNFLEAKSSLLFLSLWAPDADFFSEAQPLHVAAAAGPSDLVALLLRKGSDIEAELDPKSMPSMRPLHLAAEAGNAEVVKVLLATKADINRVAFGNKSSLCIAVENSHEKVVKLLLDAGAEFEAEDNDGWRPLYRAISEESEKVVKLLLDAGAKVEDEDENGWRPLHCAADGSDKTMELLLGAGAEVEAEDIDGWRPLHHAARCGPEKAVKLLLDAGAKVEAEDKDGWRPLHYAARRGSEKVVKLLLDAGADVDALESSGESALHKARIKGHHRIERLLLQRGASDRPSDRPSSSSGVLMIHSSSH